MIIDNYKLKSPICHKKISQFCYHLLKEGTCRVVAARALPAKPSDDNFRQALRSGMILCNVLIKIQLASVPKVTLFLVH